MAKYKNCLFVILLIAGQITLCTDGYSQPGISLKNGVNAHELAVDSFILKLPGLESLIDSAIAHAPILKISGIDLRMKELAISNARKSWSKNIISGSASYNYGDNLIISENLGIGQLSTDSKASSHYSVGFSMKIPLTSFFDHQDLRKAKMEMEKSESERLLLVKSIREDVNTRYLNLTNAYQKYKILLSDFESYEINLQNAERDFLNSRISVQELTSSKTAYSKAKLELAEAKTGFTNAIWLLEELVGFRLNF